MLQARELLRLSLWSAGTRVLRRNCELSSFCFTPIFLNISGSGFSQYSSKPGFQHSACLTIELIVYESRRNRKETLTSESLAHLGVYLESGDIVTAYIF